MIGRSLRALALVLPLLAAGCGPPNVDLQQALEVTDVTTGYADVGLDPSGKRRIVPAISFRLRKRAPEMELERISLNMAFRKAGGEGDQAVFDDIYLQRVEIGPEGSEQITVRADTGFTGDQPQTATDMLQNSRFEDLTVRILGKQGSGNWTELHSTGVERRILVQ